MTDTESAGPDPVETPEPLPDSTDRSHAPDWALRLWVEILNEDGDGDGALGITLTMGGLIVSGQLISHIRYFRELSEVLEKAPGGEGIASLMRRTKEELVDLEKELEETGRRRSEPVYIHLRDTRFYDPAGNSIPTDSSTLWRGRLSQVDGFLIGNLGPGPGNV